MSSKTCPYPVTTKPHFLPLSSTFPPSTYSGFLHTDRNTLAPLRSFMWLVPCLSSLSLNVTVSERPYITTLRNRTHTLIFYCCALTLFFMAPLKRFNYLFCLSYTRSFSVFITTGLALREQAPWLYSAHDTQSTAHGSHSVNNYGHRRSLTRSNRHCMPYLYMSGA